MNPGQVQTYSMPPNYQSEIYPPPYNPSKNYTNTAEPYQLEYSQAPPGSSYSELQGGTRNFGAYGKEMGTAGVPSGQFDYARGFAQTPYSGFYSDPLFCTFTYLTIAEPIGLDSTENAEKLHNTLGYGTAEEKKEFSEKSYPDKTTQELNQENGFGVFTKIENVPNTLKRTLFFITRIEYDGGDSYNSY